MRVGVPTEIKTDEYRVALTPSGVRELVEHGHEVLVQQGAGEGSAIADAEYTEPGRAHRRRTPQAVFAEADMVVKVKEPQAVEVAMLRPGQTLFTYLHLAPDPELTQGLVDSGATCIAYETVEDRNGRLPLLAPMSEIAGKIATQAGAFMLEKPLGGRGLLLGGVPGVAAGKVMVIGGGVVGQNAAEVAIGMGAETYVYDRNIDRLRDLEYILNEPLLDRASPRRSRSRRGCRRWTSSSARCSSTAPRPRTSSPAQQLGLMKRNAVLVDVSIDQGGCFETSRATTHSDPTYEVDGITHYCVANMPGAVPITSTWALTNATMPFVIKLADKGVDARAGRRPRLHGRAQRRRRPGHLRAGRARPGPRVHARRAEALAARRRLGSAGRSAAATCRSHAHDFPARPQGTHPEDQEARDPRPQDRQGPQEEGAAPQKRGVCTRVYTTTPEEAELGSAQGLPCPADQPDGGHGLHPR